MSKIFSDDWMIANGFLQDAKRRATVGDVLRTKTPLPPLITLQEGDMVKPRSICCANTRSRKSSDARPRSGRERNDVGVMQSVFDSADILHQPVSEVMGRAFPALEQSDEIELAYKLLTLANPAIWLRTTRSRSACSRVRNIISFLSTSSEVVRK